MILHNKKIIAYMIRLWRIIYSLYQDNVQYIKQSIKSLYFWFIIIICSLFIIIIILWNEKHIYNQKLSRIQKQSLQESFIDNKEQLKSNELMNNLLIIDENSIWKLGEWNPFYIQKKSWSTQDVQEFWNDPVVLGLQTLEKENEIQIQELLNEIN